MDARTRMGPLATVIALAMAFGAATSDAQLRVTALGGEMCDWYWGSVMLNSAATGGTPPYTFHWSPSEGLSADNVPNPMAAPLRTTVYTVTVTDGVGGVASTDVPVSIWPTPRVTVTTTPPADTGRDVEVCVGSRVTIVPHVDWGTPPYVMYWNNVTQVVTPDSPLVVEISEEGPIRSSFWVVDAHGCNSQLYPVPGGLGGIVGRPSPTVTASGGTYIPGGAGVILADTVTGTYPPYSFTWSPWDGLSSPLVQHPIATPSATTTYMLTVTTVDGCVGTASASVSVPLATPESLHMTLGPGWNLIAVPVSDSTTTRFGLFPRVISAFGRDSIGYITVGAGDRLRLGRGYWLLSPRADSAWISSASGDLATWVLTRGWNLVGGGFDTLALDSIPGLADVAELSSAFLYDPAMRDYVSTASAVPGRGLWLLAHRSAIIALPR